MSFRIFFLYFHTHPIKYPNTPQSERKKRTKKYSIYPVVWCKWHILVWNSPGCQLLLTLNLITGNEKEEKKLPPSLEWVITLKKYSFRSRSFAFQLDSISVLNQKSKYSTFRLWFFSFSFWIFSHFLVGIFFSIVFTFDFRWWRFGCGEGLQDWHIYLGFLLIEDQHFQWITC